VVPLLALGWSHAAGATQLKVVPCDWRATPGRADDDAFIRWLGRYSRLSAGPGATAAAFQAMRKIDIRQVLPHVEVPTLVLHRSGDRALPAVTARYLAEHLPNARSVELPGDDHILWRATSTP
jgi:eukaryotic-like serine/threonine-protein kinase